MSRIVEGIKELWKGKEDDDEKEYRYRYDQRQSPGSNRYYGDPANASVEARSRYPIEGRGGYPAKPIVDSRSGYPVSPTADGRVYPADGRGGFPTEGRSGYPADGRSGYAVEGRSGYPAEVRSGYAVEGRGGYPAEGRSGYSAEGRGGYPVEVRSGYPVEGRSGYAVEGRSGYPANSVADARSGYSVTTTVDGRSGYPASVNTEPRSSYPANGTASGYRKPFGQALDDDYVPSSYATRAESRVEFSKPYGISDSSPRGSEYRQPYGINEASPRRPAEVSPRVGEYVRTAQASPREYRKSSSGSVIELMVPMCCEKCKEKVQEELIEVDGVETVRCDPKNSRVIVTGDRFIDIDKCLTKSERAVKKKCELISNRDIDGTSRPEKTTPSGYYEAVERSGILAPPTVSRPSPSPGGKLVRMPSFASGKVTQYDGVGPRGQDYEPKDYNGFRRMPSLGKHKYNDAEYITSFDQRPEPSDQRSFAPIRRMPSLGRHRYNDAEYTTADYREHTPRTSYESGSSYTSAYNDRPSLLSQVSFSKIPVENPNYVKHIGSY